MNELRKYKNYYFLEDYLFDEVNKNFKGGHLTPEEFFAIIIWKSNRSKTKFNFNSDVLKQVSEALKHDSEKDKIKHLDKIRGVGISVASAILTVWDPERFTIVDKRAITSLIKILENRENNFKKDELGRKIKHHFSHNPQNSPKGYLKYRDLCKTKAEELNVSLRNFDRILVGIDVYSGNGGLKELADRLSKNI